jgi:hypothetical protein
VWIVQRFVALALALAIGMLVIVAAPGDAAPAGATRDRVVGTATHLGADPPFPRITVRIDASSDPDGSDARGTMTIRSREIGQRRRGEVTCLNVQGGTATIGIRIVQAEDPAAVGKGELFNVVDNGSGDDRIAGYPLTATPPTVCSLLDFSVPVVSGGYRVAEAAP